MAVLELLQKIRALNIRALQSAVSESSPCHVEPVFRSEDGDVAVDGPFGLPCRVDVISVRGAGGIGASIMVNPPTQLHFGDLSLTWNGLKVLIRPFGWDYVAFRCSFNSPPDWSLLTSWFWRFFDADDRNEEAPEGLYNVVHYLSDPVFENGQGVFTVDFGSCEIRAFGELMQTLSEIGANQVEVG